MPQVNCVIIWKRKALEFKRCNVTGSRVNITELWNPKFELKHFIPETISKRWFQFWKRGSHRQFLILREGIDEAILPTEGEFDKYWTPDEAKKFISKLVAKSAVKQKPFTNWQVIAIMGAIIGASIITALLTRYMIVGGF